VAARASGEWLTLALLCALGWATALSPGGALADTGICARVSTLSLDRGWTNLTIGLLLNTPGRLMLDWAAMVAAMTPLLMARPLGDPLGRTAMPRRRAGIWPFAAAYGAVWLAAGVALVPAALWLAGAVPASGWGALAVLIALGVAWRVTPFHRFGLDLCRQRPRPGSPTALHACAITGLRHGLGCLLTCWPMMVLPIAVHRQHAAAMLIAGALQLADRWRDRAPPFIPRT